VWEFGDCYELSLSIGGVAGYHSLVLSTSTHHSDIKDKDCGRNWSRGARRMQGGCSSGVARIEIGVDGLSWKSAEILERFPTNLRRLHHRPPWLNFYDPRLTVDKRHSLFSSSSTGCSDCAFLFMFVSVDDFVYGGSTISTTRQQTHRGAARSEDGLSPRLPSFKRSTASRVECQDWEYDRDFETILVAVRLASLEGRGTSQPSSHSSGATCSPFTRNSQSISSRNCSRLFLPKGVLHWTLRWVGCHGTSVRSGGRRFITIERNQSSTMVSLRGWRSRRRKRRESPMLLLWEISHK
jgi:hypothetical protein